VADLRLLSLIILVMATMQGSSISAVRIERTAHPVPSGDVSADQRDYVVRDRIELSTFR
jgi:HD superfamily phosphohydrolase